MKSLRAIFRLLFILALTAGIIHAQSTTASVHGNANDPLGILVTSGSVKLTKDKGKIDKNSHYLYSFDMDKEGNYKGDGITPGTYTLVLFRKGVTADFSKPVTMAAGQDTIVNFDMTRQEYIDKLSVDDKKILEESRKKNAAVFAENAIIRSVNSLMSDARAAMKATPPDYQKAVDDMTQATTARPNETMFWFMLGEANFGLKKYDDAIMAYKKSIDTDVASSKPSPETEAATYNNMGHALANSNKIADSAAAYEAAAKLNPAHAGRYYLNEAIAFYTASENDNANQAVDLAAAAAAADKTITVDPNVPEVYYIKGQALVMQVTTDPKTGKIIAPPGCIESYQKYLQLAPNGRYASDVKSILQGFNTIVSTPNKAGNKK
jgi:tetratricopeptide (TPR) repeat protein